MSDERYIVPTNWSTYQNADVLKKSRGGRPPWIKLYHRLLDDEGYQRLTPNRRALLLGIWMLYARTGRALREDTASISRALAQRVTSADIEALNDAGFIAVSSRETRENPLEAVANREEKRREVTPPPPRSEVDGGRGSRDFVLIGDGIRGELGRFSPAYEDDIPFAEVGAS